MRNTARLKEAIASSMAAGDAASKGEVSQA
jgi:hypothetical protein